MDLNLIFPIAILVMIAVLVKASEIIEKGKKPKYEVWAFKKSSDLVLHDPKTKITYFNEEQDAYVVVPMQMLKEDFEYIGDL